MPWNDWIRTVEVEPSLYAADFARLGDQVEALLRAGARVFHWDVGDGRFVPPITMGPIVLASISERIHALDGVVDVHLMTEEPARHFRAFADAGADSVTVHVEAVADLSAAVLAARELELQIGLALRPSTPVQTVVAAFEAAPVDMVLCMSVEPGYSGQVFVPETIGRLRWLRAMLPPQVPLQVDGGVTVENVREAHEAGATLLVAATAIFEREDIPRAYHRLVQTLA